MMMMMMGENWAIATKLRDTESGTDLRPLAKKLVKSVQQLDASLTDTQADRQTAN